MEYQMSLKFSVMQLEKAITELVEKDTGRKVTGVKFESITKCTGYGFGESTEGVFDGCTVTLGGYITSEKR